MNTPYYYPYVAALVLLGFLRSHTVGSSRSISAKLFISGNVTLVTFDIVRRDSPVFCWKQTTIRSSVGMSVSFFREAGDGPGVICFHSNCSSSGQFKSLMSAMADGHHVFAVDSYGAGKTPAWDRPEHLSLADEVALAEPVMDKAGEGIVLVGH